MRLSLHRLICSLCLTPIAVAAAVFFFAVQPTAAAEPYKLGADSQRQEGVPRGEVTKYEWKSKVFDGTTRGYWVYVPKQYDEKQPAAVMVFQDGEWYQNEKGDYRVPTVFDNLIHKGEMPITIGVFINPGVFADKLEGGKPKSNRSFEYDTLSDQYARFLLDEMLPEVGKKYRLTEDPDQRAICGISSGGICAWTVAWERPDAFRKVLSHVGSFTNIRGGHVYHALIRKSEPKPIRVFLQDGNADLNIYGGDWWMANQELERALTFAGYEVNHVWGEGGHSGQHATEIFPDAMRWLWKDWPKPVQAGGGSPQLKEILIPGEDWKLVAEGYKFTEGPAVNAGRGVLQRRPEQQNLQVGAGRQDQPVHRR